LVLNLESWAQRTRTLALTDTTTVPMFLILILLRSSRCARTANFTRTYLYYFIFLLRNENPTRLFEQLISREGG
jgi:hypothetical protein